MTTEPSAFWEERYRAHDRIWSGAANASVVDAVRELTPGRALELGCGEGADAIWLAGRGWVVTALDISATAVGRARRAATDAGIGEDRLRFAATDLASWSPDGEFDLVTAAFFQSPVALPRGEVLRRAADAVRPGGHVLVVSHGAAPPWAPPGHGHTFPTPADELAVLGLPAPGWTVLQAHARARPVTAPDGTTASLEDVVVLARKDATPGSSARIPGAVG